MSGEMRDGELRKYDIQPEEFGFAMAGSQNLRVNDAAESRTRVLEALANTTGVARDIVAFNAGAAIYAARRAETLMAGIELAQTALARGAARAKFDVFIAAIQPLKSASWISRNLRDRK